MSYEFNIRKNPSIDKLYLHHATEKLYSNIIIALYNTLKIYLVNRSTRPEE